MARRQRGWVGMLVILAALLIVAVLAQTALKRYGLLGAGSSTKAVEGLSPLTSSPAAAAAASTPSLQVPLERARAVEATVLKGAAEQDRQLEEQTR
jgi:hypothetical protein